MKRKAVFWILGLLGVSVLVVCACAGEPGPVAAAAAWSDPASSECEGGAGFPNPADVYCLELGYRLDTVEGEDVCVFPDGSSCGHWAFLEGTCGERYSYCAANGYEQITKSDGRNPFTPHYAVCVDGRTGAEVGSVSDLMRLGPSSAESMEMEHLLALGPGPQVETLFELAAVPASFDWRDHGGQDWMTAVHNQRACGSCWAFSAAGTVEAVYNIHTNFPALDLDLSEEYLNSDCPTPNPGSCCGGGHTSALGIIRDDGIPDEACMGYDEAYYGTGDCDCFGNPPCNPLCTGLPTNCSHLLCTDVCADWASRLVTIADYHGIAADEEQIKQGLVDKGPLAVCLAMSGSYDAQNVYRCTTCWDRNHNGTCETVGVCGAGGTCTSGLVGEDCTADAHCDEDKNDDGGCDQDDCGTNHCVVLTGYDDAAGAWIVKNSWGPGWGPHNSGYWEVGYGECHIEDSVYWVEPDDLNFPPIADANGPYEAECAGATTALALDGSGSVDPNAGDTLTYAWTTDCPAGSFDDASSAVPVLTVDTSPGCSVTCSASLTVTDDEGESDTDTAAVTVRDTTPPSLVGPADLTVECDASTEPADTGYATATDGCDAAPTVTYVDVEVPGSCPQEKTIQRTWTATDACGNASSMVQTITVVDTTPPLIAIPSDVTIECDEPRDPSNTGYATATDNCDGAPAISYADVVTPGSCPQEETITRTWTATDACGNASSGVQTIQVVDTTPPVIACNAPDTITPPDAPISFVATAVDNCDDDASVWITAFDCFRYTQKGKEIDKKQSCVVDSAGDSVSILDVGGVGTYITWNVYAVDGCGNEAVQECTVEIVRQGGQKTHPKASAR